MKQEITCWRDFHNLWIKKARDEGVPVFFFRFEDISRDVKPVLMDVFAFCLDRPNVQDTLIEAKINLLLKQKNEGTVKT